MDWLDRVQKKKMEEESPAPEAKRGRPKQEFEGSPIPSVGSSPATPKKRLPLSPTKSTAVTSSPLKSDMAPTSSPRSKSKTGTSPVRKSVRTFKKK